MQTGPVCCHRLGDRTYRMVGAFEMGGKYDG